MGRPFKISDVGIGVFVVLIAALLLIPLPTFLLDLLLVLNISISILLLLVGLYMPSALALLSFPSLLLLTTLFRLGLNVASTRLILSQADAGEVIEAFGTFLISGELVVGMIIFLIITVVNFMVVARGAGRVSEVAARFALDALPGKQMTIDSEQRAGLISAEEAGRRREDLRKESQLYGAMDGAMKFVAGDALAGLFITATNLLGGLYMGLQGGMSVSDAVSTYSVLTIGDGLVSQIPALLVSICAGIVVTRVASGDSTTLGSDVSEQLLARPAAFIVAGLLLSLFSFSSFLPTLPFLMVGMVLLAMGFIVLSKGSQFFLSSAVRTKAASRRSRTLSLPASQRKSIEYSEYTLEILIGSDFFPATSQASFAEYEDYWHNLLESVRSQLGLQFPSFSLRTTRKNRGDGIEVWFRGALLTKAHVETSGLFVEMSPTAAEFLGFQVLSTVDHPWDAHLCSFVADTKLARDLCKALEVPVVDAIHYTLLTTAHELLRRPEELLGVRVIFDWLAELERRRPGFVAASIDQEFFTSARLLELACAMVRSGLNIQPFEEVIEIASAYISSVDRSMVRQGEFDIEDIISFVRLQRKRIVTARYRGDTGMLRVMRMSRKSEEILREMNRHVIDGREGAAGLAEVIRPLKELAKAISEMGVSTPVVVVEQELRSRLERLLHSANESFVCLGSDEIRDATDVIQIASCDLGESVQ